MRILWILLGMVWLAGACATGMDAPGSRRLADGGEDPCGTLLDRVCGVDGGMSCAGSPSCDSARMTANYEPRRCPELLQDSNYQDCSTTRLGASTGGQNDWPDACDTLREKVCGPAVDGVRRCNGNDACVVATDVADQGDPRACRQALGDDTSFPRCPPN